MDFQCKGKPWRPEKRPPPMGQYADMKINSSGTKALHGRAAGYHERSMSDSAYGPLPDVASGENVNAIVQLNVKHGYTIRKLEVENDHYRSILKIVLPLIPTLRWYSDQLHSLVDQCISQIQAKAEELKQEDASSQEAMKALVDALEASLRTYTSPLNVDDNG